MQRVAFIDTTILCNLVPVPGRDQHYAQVRDEMKRRLMGGESFILPITAVIETGNFVAQLPDGGTRRATALRMAQMLQLVCEQKAPWVLHDVAWNRSFLEQFLDGAGTGMTFVDHTQNALGAGDLCILAERRRYQARTGIAADIWTLDTGLHSHR